MGRQHGSAERQHQAREGNAQHSGLDRVPRKAQVQATVEQHQADQQPNSCFQPEAKVKRFDQSQTGAPDQQAGQQQQHNSLKSRQSSQQTCAAPAKTVMPQSNPSLSGVIDRGVLQFHTHTDHRVRRITRYSPSKSPRGTFTSLTTATVDKP